MTLKFFRCSVLNALTLHAGLLLAFLVSTPLSAQSILLDGSYSPEYNGTDNPWNIQGSLIIGNGSFGSMTVEGAAVVNNEGGTVRNGGFVVVSGEGAQWNNSQRLTLGGLGNSGALTIENGGLVAASSGLIGGHSDTNGNHGSGTLGVSGAGSTLDIPHISIAGSGTTGNLTIEDGGSVESQILIVGRGNSAVFGGPGTGNVLINGGGSSLSASSIQIGGEGNGTFEVQAGSILTDQVEIAEGTDSTGSLILSGSESSWANSLAFYVGGNRLGAQGDGELQLDNGAVLEINETLKVWETGAVNVNGGTLNVGTIDLALGASFNVESGTLIADSILGDLTMDGGILSPGDSPGTTTISGDFFQHGGELKIEISGMAAGEFDFVDVSGDIILNGVVDLDLLDGYTPQLGDSFQILAGLSYSGSPVFDLSDAQLNVGLRWDTSDFLSNGTVSIQSVPEPSGVGLGLFAIVLISFRRSRSA